MVLDIFFVSCQMWVLTDYGMCLGLTEVTCGVVFCCFLGGMDPAVVIAFWPASLRPKSPFGWFCVYLLDFEVQLSLHHLSLKAFN